MGNGVYPKIIAYVPILNRHVPRVPRQIDTDTQKVEWWAFFDGRTGIREYDGELARPAAERQAYADTVAALCPVYFFSPTLDPVRHSVMAGLRQLDQEASRIGGPGAVAEISRSTLR